MLLLIDNYDSFTYNIVHYLGQLGVKAEVYRNDALSVQEALALKPAAIVISPGPCDPNRAGICLPLLRAAAQNCIPALGVCLGHQALGQIFGGSVIRAAIPVHGKTSQITHNGTGVFTGLPSPLTVTRYHSLVVDPAGLSDELEINATTDDGLIMGLRHKTLPLHGVQFHPESIATEKGHDIFRNFLALAELPLKAA
jgi:anthranilate synthase component 2